MKASIKKKIQRFVITGVLGSILFFFLMHRLIVFTPGIFEEVSSYFLYPLFVVEKSIVTPLKKLSSAYANYGVFDKQLKELHEERERLLSQIVRLEASSQVYQDIREIVAFNQRYETSYQKLVQVMIKCLSSYEQSILVDSGSHHGIEKDMAVVYKDALVGRVTEVYPYLSKIILITDKHCSISCYCSKTKTKGIFQGTNSVQTASLIHVDRLCTVSDDELVISSGEGTIFPAGFLVGRVTSHEPNGVHLTVRVQPHIDMEKLEYVYIIKKGAEPLLKTH